jgi:hypothetical protein
MSSDKLSSVAFGMGGLLYVKEALEEAKSAATTDEKVAKLTDTLELVIARLQHLDDERQRELTNLAMGNVIR